MNEHRYRGLRQKMIINLRLLGITDQAVLSAMLSVPRHKFLDQAFADWAYKDQAFPIEAGQTISQPSTVAWQTSLLALKGGEKVLEIGTGSGYQACVLAEMNVKLYTIERQERLFRKTNDLLQQLSYGQIRTLFGDGYEGAPRFAPFDRILVTAGGKDIPKLLCRQLKVGGWMIIPIADTNGQQIMYRIDRLSNHRYTRTTLGKCAFVPFLEGVQKI